MMSPVMTLFPRPLKVSARISLCKSTQSLTEKLVHIARVLPPLVPMRRLSSPSKKAIVVPPKLRGLVDLSRVPIYSKDSNAYRNFLQQYAAIPQTSLDEKRQIKYYNAEVVYPTHRTARALLPHNTADPTLIKDHVVPTLGRLQFAQPHVIHLREYHEVSTLSKACATMLERVRKKLFDTGFLRTYDDTGKPQVLSSSEERERIAAHQMCAHYSVLELEYQDHARQLHESLSPALVAYTNEAEARHHMLMQLVLEHPIENLFINVSTQLIYRSIQRAFDDVPVILCKYKLNDIAGHATISGEVMQTSAPLDENAVTDLVSISELAYVLASEQSVVSPQLSTADPPPNSDILTLGRYLNTTLFSDKENSTELSEVVEMSVQLFPQPSCSDYQYRGQYNEKCEEKHIETQPANHVIVDAQTDIDIVSDFGINQLLTNSRDGDAEPEQESEPKASRPFLLQRNRMGWNSPPADYKQVRGSNPLLHKAAEQTPSCIDGLVGKALDAPPLKPRTVSRLSLVRQVVSPPTRTSIPTRDSFYRQSIPLTKVTFQSGSPATRSMPEETHKQHEALIDSAPISTDDFDILERLPQSQNLLVRAKSMVSRVRVLDTQDKQSGANKVANLDTTLKEAALVTNDARQDDNQLPTSCNMYATFGTKFRDRFGSPLWSLTQSRLKTEIINASNYRDLLMGYVQYFQHMPNSKPIAPESYKMGHLYTSWLINMPIKSWTVIKKMTPSWPSESSRVRILAIRSLPSDTALILKKNLFCFDPLYADFLQDIKDLCLSIHWMLGSTITPGWYIPNKQAMRTRRAEMDREMLMRIGVLGPYDDRVITPTTFTRLTSPQRDARLTHQHRSAITESSCDTLEQGCLSTPSQSQNTKAISTICFQGQNINELYKQEVPTATRFNFASHRIVYGGCLTSSIPYYNEDLEFILSELQHESVRKIITYGEEVSSLIRRHKNNRYMYLPACGYPRPKNVITIGLVNTSPADNPSSSDNDSPRQPEMRCFLANGGITPNVSPCLSEIGSILAFTSSTAISKECSDRDSSYEDRSSGSDSQISLLCETNDIAIGCRQQHKRHVTLSISDGGRSHTASETELPINMNDLHDSPLEAPFEGYVEELIHQISCALANLEENKQHVHSSAYGTTRKPSSQKHSRYINSTGIISVYRTADHSPTMTINSPVSETAATNARLSEDNNLIGTDLRELRLVDACYPHRQRLRKGYYENLQFLADFSYIEACEKRKTEVCSKYSLSPDIYLADASIERNYDKPLLPRYTYSDVAIVIGIQLTTPVQPKDTETDTSTTTIRPVHVIDDFTGTIREKLSRRKSDRAQSSVTAPLYLPSLYTILAELSKRTNVDFSRSTLAWRDTSTARKSLPAMFTDASSFSKPLQYTQSASLLRNMSTARTASTMNMHALATDITGKVQDSKATKRAKLITFKQDTETSASATTITTKVDCANLFAETETISDSLSDMQFMAVESTQQRTTHSESMYSIYPTEQTFDQSTKKYVNSAAHAQSFSISDANLLAVFSMRISDLPELFNNLIDWVESMHTFLMLDGRALLSSICGVSYWAIVADSSIKLKTRVTQDLFTAIYKRYLHSKYITNKSEIGETVPAAENITEEGVIARFQLFEEKRARATRFLKLANILYAECVAEAVSQIVCQTVLPVVATILATITKEAAAMIDLARIIACKYSSYIQHNESEYTVTADIVTEHLKVVEYCESLMSQIFWLFRCVKGVDNNIITVPMSHSGTDVNVGEGVKAIQSAQGLYSKMAQIVIPTIPTLRTAWNVCKLLFCKVRKTLNVGVECLIRTPELLVLPSYASGLTLHSTTSVNTLKESEANTTETGAAAVARSAYAAFIFGGPAIIADRQKNTASPTLQLEFTLQRGLKKHVLADLSQFAHLLPKSDNVDTGVDARTGVKDFKKFWPLTRYGCYHLLHDFYKNYMDSVEPIKSYIAYPQDSNNKDVYDQIFAEDISDNANVSLICTDDDFVMDWEAEDGSSQTSDYY